MIHKLVDDRRKVLGLSLGGIWIGDCDAVKEAEDCGALLNVAQDLRPQRGWPDTESMHVGLIDGPGNEVAAYCAAIYAIDALIHRHNVLIYCHSGGRALAVALMYLCAASKQSWDTWLQLLTERVEGTLPRVLPIHKDILPDVLRRLA